MLTIRFHGRGGQGMKTASHFLGNAFFLADYEVQDAPRYGAERRGAPMTAYVRADKKPIFERGIIKHPALVVVADDTLVPIAAAGVMAGVKEETVLLIVSDQAASVWQQRLNIESSIRVLPPQTSSLPLVSAACAGAAACLSGVITQAQLVKAIKQELMEVDQSLIQQNIEAANEAFERMQINKAILRSTAAISASDFKKPDWVDLPLETSDISAPIIHAAQTSVKIRTGLWRTQRPVINYDRCNQCWWICSSSCPDAVINIENSKNPVIDYDHCKGCMICVAQCPAHAIESIAEADAQQGETK